MFLWFGQNKKLLLLLWMIFGAASPAFSVNLSGNWSYWQNGGADQETQTFFQQNYQLGLGPQLSLQPTSAITLSGGVGYLNTQQGKGDGAGFETVEQVSPRAQLSLLNDIFSASVSAYAYMTLAGSETSSSFWSASLRSAWHEPLWPNLSLDYGEDFASVNNASLFDDSQGKEQSTTFKVDWDLLLADLYYEFSYNELITGQGESQRQDSSHYVNIDTRGSFWGNRIGYNLDQKFRQVVSAGSIDSDVINPDDTVALVRGTTYFAADAAAAIDESIQLVEAPVLNNKSLNDGDPVVVAVGEHGYFGFKSDLSTPVAELNLYLDPDSAPPNLSQLQWALYRKIPNSVNSKWSKVTDLSPVYESVEVQTVVGLRVADRFRFTVNISDQEFMVVLTNPNSSGTTLSFSELNVISSFFSDSGNSTTATSYKTNFGLRYRIAQSLNASFHVNYEHLEVENGPEIVSESDKLSWSSQLGWSPSQYFSPSLSYSEYLETQQTLDADAGQMTTKEYRNTAYSLTASSRLLPSVNVSFGLTHNEQFQDREKIEISDIFSLSSQIKIYPDLTASVSTSLSDVDRLVTDNDRTFFTNTESINTRLDIVAQLTRKLYAYLSTNHNASESELNGTSDSVNSVYRLSYRPSDILSLQSSYSMFFGDDQRTNSLNNSIDLYLLRTYKTRLSLAVSHVLADESLYGLRTIGSWDISDYFTLSTTGSYALGPINSYSLNLNLAMRL